MNQLVPVSNTPMKSDPKIENSLAKVAEFLKEYQPPASEALRDMLDGQYKIDLGTPLPQFNSSHGKAYAAVNNNDDAPIFALVCEPGSIPRHSTMEKMLLVRNPGLCSVVAYGAVELSQPAEERFVIFFERPKGQRLSAMLSATQGKVPPNIIINRIIQPITNAIVALQEADITHGSINPDNIYYDTQAVLGPCVAEPCGYSQPHYYELVERMQAMPAGKGNHHIGADYYALAVLVLEILNGKQMLARLGPEQLARTMLRQGPFMTLTGGRDVQEDFFDFLWGMLGSGINQRWNYRYLKPWLDGKRYHIVASPAPTEGAKPLEIFGTTCHSRREIAQMMREHWGQTQEALAHSHLTQWVLMVLRQKDLSELIARHVKTIVESGTRNELQRNEFIMRLILILDEAGPLQYLKLAVHPEGISTLFADLFIKQQHDEIQLLVKFIEQNLISIWMDLQQVREIEIPEHMIQFFTKLDRIRGMLRNTGPGFGIERLLYDLNPEMPCLSPLCRGRHITTLTALLKHLDRISASHAGSQDPIDAHIAAFLASKLMITSEIKLYDLSANPTIASNKALLALKLFAVAQHRAGNLELLGLTHWVAQRALPSMQFLRSSTVRGRTLQMLLDEALEGRTQRLGDLLLDGEIVNVDQTGFKQASTNYLRNANRIEHYRSGASVDNDSSHLGGIIAKIFAYTALLLSIYKIYMAYQQ